MALKIDQPTLQETPASQTIQTLPPLETSSTSFEAPQNWGTPTLSITDPVGAIRESSTTNPVIAPARQDSGGVGESTMSKRSLAVEVDSPPSVLKIILISLALILLGVLLGVLAAKFYSPATPAKNDSLVKIPINSAEEAAQFASISATANIPTISPSPTPTPMATPSSLLNQQWKAKIVKSLVPNQLSFKLNYPSSWTIKNSANTSSKLEITLMKGNNVFGIGQSNDDTNPYRKCNYDSKKEDANSINLGVYSEIVSSSLVWRVAPSILKNNNEAESYFVCEKNNKGDFISPTVIGMIGLESPTNDQTVLDEFKYILQKIEIMGSDKTAKPATTSASLKDLSS